MDSIYFSYFSIPIIGLIGIIIAIGFIATNWSKRIFGIVLLTFFLLFVILDLLTAPDLSELKEKFRTFQKIEVDSIVFYKNEDDLLNNRSFKTISDHLEIMPILNGLNLRKGLFFKDITTRNGFSDHIIVVNSNNENFIFELYTDIDGTKVVEFFLDVNSKGLSGHIGSYYYNKQ